MMSKAGTYVRIGCEMVIAVALIAIIIGVTISGGVTYVKSDITISSHNVKCLGFTIYEITQSATGVVAGKINSGMIFATILIGLMVVAGLEIIFQLIKYLVLKKRGQKDEQ